MKANFLRLIDGTVIEIGHDYTYIKSSDSRSVSVLGCPRPDQVQTAHDLGYVGDTAALCRDHDPLHAILACALGYGHSYSLRFATSPGSLSTAEHTVARREEAAVMALQSLSRAHGMTARDVAKRFGVLVSEWER